jgi:hypothetical protein
MNIYHPKPEEIPSGLCECGCGRHTPIATVTYKTKRQFRGHPMRFCRGHSPVRLGAARCESWRGGQYVHRGWIYKYQPDHPNCNADGYVFEHRLIMEQSIGRLLLPNERVHHINGVHNDNRIDNLVLLTMGQHSSLHNKGRKQNLTPEERQNRRDRFRNLWNRGLMGRTKKLRKTS